MNGGYIMIKASDADIYAGASRALNIGKPILFYENDTTCYYIDTITLDGTNVVLTKGGKTITIANDNTITTSGNIQNHLYQHFISFNEIKYDEGGTTKYGYIHLCAPIISTKENALSLEEILNYLIGFDNDYYQLGLVGSGDLENIQYVYNFTLSETTLSMSIYVSDILTNITIDLDDLDYSEYGMQLF